MPLCTSTFMDSEKPFDSLEIEAMLEVERVEKCVWHVCVNAALMFRLEKEQRGPWRGLVAAENPNHSPEGLGWDLRGEGKCIKIRDRGFEWFASDIDFGAPNQTGTIVPGLERGMESGLRMRMKKSHLLVKEAWWRTTTVQEKWRSSLVSAKSPLDSADGRRV